MAAEVLGIIDFAGLSHQLEWLLALGLPIVLQFSSQTVSVIRNRDRMKPENGEKLGKPFCRMCNKVMSEYEGDVAHINHNHHDKKKYDSESNGRLVCDRCHYVDHANRAGRNGVNPHQEKGVYFNGGESNDFAMRKLWNKLSEEDRVGLLSPEEIKEKRIQKHSYSIALPILHTLEHKS